MNVHSFHIRPSQFSIQKYSCLFCMKAAHLKRLSLFGVTFSFSLYFTLLWSGHVSLETYKKN